MEAGKLNTDDIHCKQTAFLFLKDFFPDIEASDKLSQPFINTYQWLNFRLEILMILQTTI